MEYDILSIHDRKTSLKLEGSAITSLKNTEIQRYGVRRFEEGRMFQTSRLGQVTEERLLADTREWGGPGTSHDYGFAPAHKESRIGKETNAEVLKEYEDSIKELAGQFPNYVFHGGCNIERITTSLTSSYGLDLKSSGDACEWYVVYQRQGSGNAFDGFCSEHSAIPNIRDTLLGHSEYLKVQKNEVPLKNGRMPILFAESPTQPLAKLVESFYIHRYRDGACVFSNKLGETLFSPKVTLVDQSYDPASGLNNFFDGEGVVRQNGELKLIDKGRFANLISDLRFGKKFGVPSTGNGMRGYKSGVSLSTRSLRVAKGQKPWREILKGLDRCIVAFIAAGGDSNDLGEFSTPIQVGFVFEKGEVIGATPQITIKTSVSNYLGQGLIDISSDGFHATSPSACIISEVDVMVN